MYKYEFPWAIEFEAIAAGRPVRTAGWTQLTVEDLMKEMSADAGRTAAGRTDDPMGAATASGDMGGSVHSQGLPVGAAAAVACAYMRSASS